MTLLEQIEFFAKIDEFQEDVEDAAGVTLTYHQWFSIRSSLSALASKKPYLAGLLTKAQRKQIKAISSAAERLAKAMASVSEEVRWQLQEAHDPPFNALNELSKAPENRRGPLKMLCEPRSVEELSAAAEKVLKKAPQLRKGQKLSSISDVQNFASMFRMLSMAERSSPSGTKVNRAKFVGVVFELLPAHAKLRLQSVEAILKSVRRFTGGQKVLH